jgi:hypothetical protein
MSPRDGLGEIDQAPAYWTRAALLPKLGRRRNTEPEMRHRLPALATAAVLLVGGAGAFAQAEAERRLDAALSRLRAALGPGVELTIGARRVDPVTGRITLSDVAISEGTNRYTVPELLLADLSDTRIGRLEAVRLRHASTDGNSSRGEVGRVLVAGLTLPEPGKPFGWQVLAAEALELEAFRAEAPGQGRVRVDRLSVREARREGIATGVVEGVDFAGGGAQEPSFQLGRVALEALVLPLAGDSFDPLAFRAGQVTVDRFALRDPDKQVTLSLGRLALRDWLPGRATSLMLEDARVAAPTSTVGAGEFSVSRIEAAGVDAVRTIDALVQGVQIPDPLPGTPQRLLIERLDAALDGQRIFTLARLLSEGTLREGMASGSLSAEGMRAYPPAGQAAWLEGLGYKEVTAGLELRGSIPRAGGTLTIEPLRLEWENAAALSLSARFEGMPGAPAEGAQVDPDATVAQLVAARIGGVVLTLRDQGLLGRLIAQQAREQRVPEARLREQWAQIAMAMPLPGGGPPARRGAAPAQGKGAPADPMLPLRQAMAAFIRQPGTLQITLQPPKPVSFAEVGAAAGGNPAAVVELLGLSAVAR